MPSERLFPVLSRIPYTAEWRLYRDVTRWLRKAGQVIQEAVPGSPVAPIPDRDLRALLLHVKYMEAILLGVERWLAGAGLEQGWAVIREHAPTA